uniref:Uncharacterized protein n=1 Tax=Caenorhabditis japonica TaxID=281687 RepID=A0A8R1DX18_CAEJA
MWASVLGHDSENGFAHADKDFHKYLMDHGKQLENSFVFFLGDHGLRFGNVRKTFVGALDVNNPMTAVSIPNSLRNTTSILEILKENAKKVQSHYDTRATMLDIMKTLQLLQYQHKFKGATLYEVSVKMQEPSNAEFKGKVKILDDKVQVLGLVERINQYGKTADCINSQYHRPFCYCKNQENDGKKATKKKPN